MTDRIGGAPAKAPRDHLYITPRRRRLSEYEAVTCYTQPGPEAFDIEGWFTLGAGPEYRTAWRKESTRLVHPHWWDFRDPAQQWQRTYVRMQAEQERSIERVTEDAARGAAFADVDRGWLRDIVGGHYRIWSFSNTPSSAPSPSPPGRRSPTLWGMSSASRASITCATLRTSSST
jgi:Methane/Phenol/Toluene Hydroxylase